MYYIEGIDNHWVNQMEPGKGLKLKCCQKFS